MGIKDRFLRAFDGLDPVVKYAYFFGALGVNFGVPWVPRIILGVCFLLTFISISYPWCNEVAFKIEYWGRKRYGKK